MKSDTSYFYCPPSLTRTGWRGWLFKLWTHRPGGRCVRGFRILGFTMVRLGFDSAQTKCADAQHERLRLRYLEIRGHAGKADTCQCPNSDSPELLEFLANLSPAKTVGDAEALLAKLN